MSLLLLLALWSSLTACSGVRVTSESVGDEPLRGVSSYCWVSRSAPGDVAGRPTFEPELSARAQAAVDAEFARRGWSQVRESRADVLVAEHLFIESVDREMDPYFNYYTVETDEIGRFALELFDPEAGERLWMAVAERQLRVVSRGVGVSSVRSVQTEAERDWQLDAMVSRVLDALPATR